ncbi:MAG TPA: hypothetical protein VK586_19720 [Streptosporangiaceae bacterium]|nr:hypothetical protein [Streptosporangiaceae bacterium]
MAKTPDQAPSTRPGTIPARSPAGQLRVQTATDDITRSQQVIAAGHAAGGRPGFWSAIGTVLSGPGYFSKDNIQAPGPGRLTGTGGTWKDTTPQHGPGCARDDPPRPDGLPPVPPARAATCTATAPPSPRAASPASGNAPARASSPCAASARHKASCRPPAPPPASTRPAAAPGWHDNPNRARA